MESWAAACAVEVLQSCEREVEVVRFIDHVGRNTANRYMALEELSQRALI